MSDAALRERVEYLEAENAELRRRLRADPDAEFIALAKTSLDIPPAAARLLWVLWDGRVKSKESIFDAMFGSQVDQPDIKIVDVYICRLRKALSPLGTGVKTHWSLGYQLLPADREKVAAHIGVEVGL